MPGAPPTRAGPHTEPPGRFAFPIAHDATVAPFLRRLGLLGGLISLLVVGGTVGFVITEDVSAWRGFQWTLDTIATVGSIPDPDETRAQVLKVVLIVLGVGTLFYALVTVTEFFVAGHLGGLLSQRRTRRMIQSLSDHHVICGFGRVGRQVARDLKAAGHEFVVVDFNPDNRELAEAIGAPFITGQPSDDEVMLEAGIERARAVLACVDSDAENIFVTLTARELRPDITIVARASVSDSEKKLLRAGADRVISPYKTSGTEMARLALHPQVTGVVDVAPEYRMEEIEVSEECPGVGQSVGQVRGSAVIVAVRRSDGDVEPQPAAETTLRVGDVVVAMGTDAAMDRLEGLFAPIGRDVEESSPSL
ncbi:MAG TPA: TrkA family potassium uptake protein [Solirubrobacterales bacterium]|nr:TrkA family potassium uptake protein [Solirubrobacterales bacterium]